MVQHKHFTRVKKRDGSIASFDKEKIAVSIFKAAQSVGGKDDRRAAFLADKVVEMLEERFTHTHAMPSVEDVADAVEFTLIEHNHATTAKAYILYRYQKKKERDAKAALMGGAYEKTALSMNALTVLEKRYLKKDKDSNVIETPGQMFHRVAENIAQADSFYGTSPAKSARTFFDMMDALEFLPNSPTLMNAGTDLQQLSACFVLPVGDSMEEIFNAVKYAALIHKTGGGTGFSFSRLRPKDDTVRSTTGVSSGPVTFMKVFNTATDVVKQGGRRRGANMGILRIDHPDIMDFIFAKSSGKQFQNFNISVAVTDAFMEALTNNGDYELINPRTGLPAGKLNARHVFESIISNAWARGDPGLVFIDRINQLHPARHLGEIEATNPCGEQPLLPYESCNLGSINLAKMLVDNNIEENKIDWEKFKKTIHNAVHFLDNVIDMNKYPLPEIDRATKRTRKIGLGIMGFADVLYMLGIPYNSEKGLAFAEEIMAFLQQEALNASQKLAEKRGVFPAWKGSAWYQKGIKVRNTTMLTMAPTGTISMIADTSSGLEPNFALCYIKNVMDGTELFYVNRYFEKVAQEQGFFSENLMRTIAKRGSIQDIETIPDQIKKIFVVAQDITPEWHVRMQGAFQKYVDSSVSKTINFPKSATLAEVERAYLLAYELGCKGITVYRDGSLENQVLNIEKVNKPVSSADDENGAIAHTCPECKSLLEQKEGCTSCPNCGWSKCS
ncbi:ribonucleoside-diphosphate reductase, adenosylcobalamin-dependent [Candidatus Woesearchaeota archaeon CG_4_10_14_0_8_um_filter_47_5]|nr:MAG: ribonucleoside-diphosphate reductase, adenosylcobalamin-dependent [Candidatus Woesearchaeota archaeon CG_4_10_14_0_8_um_filter_47_5]